MKNINMTYVAVMSFQIHNILLHVWFHTIAKVKNIKLFLTLGIYRFAYKDLSQHHK